MNHAERIIVALDFANKDTALGFVKSVPEIRFVKVGLELFYASGPDIIDELKKLKLRIFLDLKLHDIPNTVSQSVKVLDQLRCEFLTVHALGGLEMLQAATASASYTKILAVTQLTSLNQDKVTNELGISGSIHDSVLRYSALANQASCFGVIASAHEAASIKAEFPKLKVITPGVRKNLEKIQDQQRVATISQAFAGGAEHVVLGRPITQAADPKRAFGTFLEEVRHALS